MKKLLFFTMSAMLLAACSSEELSVQESPSEASGNAVVKFDAYALRGLTRAGEVGDVTNDNIGTKGFGVFAYYTDGAKYSKTATPDFMYNQKVVKKTGDAWTYEPAKYWPNEFGETAKSEGTDYVTFFAYAPWTEFVPTTGKPVTTNARDERYNIIGIKDNSTAGDPIVQYVVDTDPTTSVDLLWGVAKENPSDYYQPIAGTVAPQAGYPFINMVKPSNPAADKLSFNLRHALAKVKVTIDFIADAATPTGTSADINPNETRIYVREASISGFALEGALNLNNVEANKPLWKDIDGEKNLAFADYVEFFDGRRDGYEGTPNGINNGEINAMLNPAIVENYAATEDGKFAAAKTSGVTATPQYLFTSTGAVTGDADQGFFYFIPRNGGQAVDLRLLYDVETIDARVAGLLADRVTHGKSIANNITKEAIFGANVDFEPGKQYVIKIHLGMTSVKVDAEVTEWTTTDPVNVDVPEMSPLQQALQSAIAYTYSDRPYSGDWSVTNTGDPMTVTYTNTIAAAMVMESGRLTILNDIARFLGALYRAGGIQSVTFQGTDYTWDPNGTLKGSNWANGNVTLVEAVVAAFSASLPNLPSSVEFSTDKGNIKVVLDVH